jgi:hypothetical protein
MTNKERFSDSAWLQQRYTEIDEIVEDWKYHSRQTESRSVDVLFYVPDDILAFVRRRIKVVWKRGKEVGVLVPASALRERNLIVMDTKLENSSIEVCRAILALKIAEAFLLEHPEEKKERRELVEAWEIDLRVLEGEHAWGFIF